MYLRGQDWLGRSWELAGGGKEKRANRCIPNSQSHLALCLPRLVNKRRSSLRLCVTTFHLPTLELRVMTNISSHLLRPIRRKETAAIVDMRTLWMRQINCKSRKSGQRKFGSRPHQKREQTMRNRSNGPCVAKQDSAGGTFGPSTMVK